MTPSDQDYKPRSKVKKISISLSDDVLEWVFRNKDELKVSTFINKVLRDRMRSETLPGECSAEVKRLERRLEALERDFRQCFTPAEPVGEIAEAAPQPHDVFGELVTIKNVSAENARAVRDELIPFLIERGGIDKNIAVHELFPHTRSAITNEINYWYNACRGILDHLVVQGYVVKEHRSRYRWIGRAGYP